MESYTTLRIYKIQTSDLDRLKSEFQSSWEEYSERAPFADTDRLYRPLSSYDLYIFCGKSASKEFADIAETLSTATRGVLSDILVASKYKKLAESASLLKCLEREVVSPGLSKIVLVPTFIDQCDRLSQVLDAINMTGLNPGHLSIFGELALTEPLVESLISFWKMYFEANQIRKTSMIENIFQTQFHISPKTLRGFAADLTNPKALFDVPQVRNMVALAHSTIYLSNPLKWDTMDLNVFPNPLGANYSKSFADSVVKNDDRLKDLLFDIVMGSGRLVGFTLDEQPPADSPLARIYFPNWTERAPKIDEAVSLQKELGHHLVYEKDDLTSNLEVADLEYRINSVDPLNLVDIFNRFPLSTTVPFMKMFDRGSNAPVYKIYKPATQRKGNLYQSYIPEKLFNKWLVMSTDWRLINDRPAALKKSTNHLSMIMKIGSIITASKLNGTIKDKNDDGTYDIMYKDNKEVVVPFVEREFITAKESVNLRIGDHVEFSLPQYQWAVIEVVSRRKVIKLVSIGGGAYEEVLVTAAEKLKLIADALYNVIPQLNTIKDLYNPVYISDWHNNLSSCEQNRNVVSLKFKESAKVTYDKLSSVMDKFNYYLAADTSVLGIESRVKYNLGGSWVDAKILSLSSEVIGKAKEKTYEITYKEDGKTLTRAHITRDALRYADYFFVRWNNIQRSNRALKEGDFLYQCRIGISLVRPGHIIVENATSTIMLEEISQVIYNFIKFSTGLSKEGRALLAIAAEEAKEVEKVVEREQSTDEVEIQDVDDFELLMEGETAEAAIVEELAPADDGEVLEAEPLFEAAPEEAAASIEIQRGRTPFLTRRLLDADPDLFTINYKPASQETAETQIGEFYGHVYLQRKRDATEKTNYSYSRQCPENRRPMVIADEVAGELREDSGAIALDPSGPGYMCETAKDVDTNPHCNAIRYGSSADNQHWYICPRIFDAVEGRPLKVEDLEFEREFVPTQYTEQKGKKTNASHLWRTDKKSGKDILEFAPKYKGRTPASSYSTLGDLGNNTIWITGKRSGEHNEYLPDLKSTGYDAMPYSVCCYKTQSRTELSNILGHRQSAKTSSSKWKKEWGTLLASERVGFLSKELLFYFVKRDVIDNYSKYASNTQDLPLDMKYRAFYRIGLTQSPNVFIDAIARSYNLAHGSLEAKLISNLSVDLFLQLNSGNIRVEFDNPYSQIKPFQTYIEFLSSDQQKPIKYVYDLLSHSELYGKNPNGVLIVLFEVVYKATTEEVTMYIPGYCNQRFGELLSKIDEIDIVFLLKHNNHIDLLGKPQPRTDRFQTTFRFNELEISTRHLLTSLAQGRARLLKNESPITLISNIAPEIDIDRALVDSAESSKEACDEVAANLTANWKSYMKECIDSLNYEELAEQISGANDKYASYAVNAKGERIGIVTEKGFYIPVSPFLRPSHLPKLPEKDIQSSLKSLTKSYKETQEFYMKYAKRIYAPPVYVFGEPNPTAILNARGLVCMFQESEISDILPNSKISIEALNKQLYMMPKSAQTDSRKTVDEVSGVISQYGMTVKHRIEGVSGMEAVTVLVPGKMEVVVPIRPVRIGDSKDILKITDRTISNARAYIEAANSLKKATEGKLPCMVIRGVMDENKNYVGLLVEGDFIVPLKTPMAFDEDMELNKQILDSYLNYDVLEPTEVVSKKFGELSPAHKMYAVKDFVFREMAAALQRYEMRGFRNLLTRIFSRSKYGRDKDFVRMKSDTRFIIERLMGLIAQSGDSDEEFDNQTLPLTKCKGWTLFRSAVCICKKGATADLISLEDIRDPSKEIVAELDALNQGITKYRETNKCAMLIPRSIRLADVLTSIVNDLMINQFKRYQLLTNSFQNQTISSLYHTENPLEEIMSEKNIDPRYRLIQDAYDKVKRNFYRGIVPYGETTDDVWGRIKPKKASPKSVPA